MALLPVAIAILWSFYFRPKRIARILREIIAFAMSDHEERQDEVPTGDSTNLLEDMSGGELLKVTLSHPPMVTKVATNLYLPTGDEIMRSILKTFEDDQSTVSLLMGQISKLTSHFPNDPDWVQKMCEPETIWFQQNSQLIEQIGRHEYRFGEQFEIKTGAASAENKELLDSNSLDLLLGRPLMGPLYTACMVLRYARSKSGKDEKLKKQYAHILLQCFAVHEQNVISHLGKFGISAAVKQYRSVIPKLQQLEFQPSEELWSSCSEADQDKLLGLDAIFSVSMGVPRIGVRLQSRPANFQVQKLSNSSASSAENAVGADGSDDDGEVGSSDSICERTRSKSSKNMLRRIDELEAKVNSLQRGFNSLHPRRSGSQCCSEASSGSSGSRKRSTDQSPEIRDRNFMKPVNPRKRNRFQKGGRDSTR